MVTTVYDTLLLAKREGTKGVDSAPAPATNALRAKSIKFTKNQTIIDRAVVKQTMGNLPHLVGKETAQIEIVCELRGSGVAGTAPDWGELAVACRNVETIVGATSCKYSPSSASANDKGVTIYYYADGLLHKLVGAVGDAKLDAGIDGIATITFTMQAAYSAPTAIACPTGAVYQSSQPLVLSSASTVSDGAAINVGSFALAMGCDVQNHYTTGQNSFVVANRKPTVTFNKDSVGTAAEWSALSSGTNASLSASLGVTAGNIATITAPVARRNSLGYNVRAERNTLDVSYGLYESASDDQFAILLT
jgi:hypothetical protein